MILFFHKLSAGFILCVSPQICFQLSSTVSAEQDKIYHFRTSFQRVSKELLSSCTNLIFLFSEFYLILPIWNLSYEQKTKFVPATESAGQPGSYEVACEYFRSTLRFVTNLPVFRLSLGGC